MIMTLHDNHLPLQNIPRPVVSGLWVRPIGQPGPLLLPMTYIHVDQTPGNQRKGRHDAACFHGSCIPDSRATKLGGDKHEDRTAGGGVQLETENQQWRI